MSYGSGNVGTTSAEERRKLREQRRMEREQKMLLREMRRQRQSAKKNTASSKIPAKWYARGSKAIAIGDNSTGEKVVIKGGMFYAGSNVSEQTMVIARIKEPSLINPLYEIRFSDEPVRKTDKSPIYSTLSPEQRGEYIRFLASDRTSTPDIGYPFIYLYGLERRLLVDTRKPNEVSDKERMMVSAEVLRLLRCFGEESKSFALYAASLLLYDGTLAKQMSEEEFLDTFAGDLTSRRFDWHALTGAYEYMLLARMAERNMRFPERDFLNYCRMRPFFGNGASFLGYGEREMYRSPSGKSAWALMVRRYENSSLSGQWPGNPSPTMTAIGRRTVPDYAPGSRSIGRGNVIRMSSALPDLECFDAPFKQVADLGTTAMAEVAEYREILENKSFGALGNVRLDVVGTVTPPRMLARDVRGKKAFTLLARDTMAHETERQLGLTPAVTKSGVLTAQTQSAYQIMAATVGWQVIVPDALPKEIGKLIKVGLDDDLVAFKRGGQYDVRNGIQFIGSLTSSRDIEVGIHLDEGWMPSVRAAIVFAWFVRQFSRQIPIAEFGKYLGIFRPPIKKRRSNRQIVMFYCLVNAFMRYALSPSAPREGLRGADFSVVKRAVFAWCYDRYGLMLPHDVMSALEKLYARASADKAMILYDYHAFTAGDASLVAGGDSFAIDDERLRGIIEDTSGVHSILSDAMATDDQDEDDSPDLSEERDVDVLDDKGLSPDLPQPEDTGEMNVTAVAREYIRSLYADAQSDEVPTRELQSALMSQFDLPTTAAALGLLSDVNAMAEEETGEPLVEVDGPDAYLNE